MERGLKMEVLNILEDMVLEGCLDLNYLWKHEYLTQEEKNEIYDSILDFIYLQER